MIEFNPTHTLIEPVEHNHCSYPAGSLIECIQVNGNTIALAGDARLIPTTWDNLLVINQHMNFSTEDTYNE